MIYKFLFPSNPNSTGASLFLLILRVFFGLLLMNHGIQKWSNFQELSAAFPDPLGVGSPFGLWGWPFLENCMFYGLYRGVALSFGDAADDFYNGDGFLCYSR